MTFSLRPSDSGLHWASWFYAKEKVLPFISSHLHYNTVAKTDLWVKVFREPSVMCSLLLSWFRVFHFTHNLKKWWKHKPLMRISECVGGYFGMALYLSKEGKGQKNVDKQCVAGNKQTLKLRCWGGSVRNMYCMSFTGGGWERLRSTCLDYLLIAKHITFHLSPWKLSP